MNTVDGNKLSDLEQWCCDACADHVLGVLVKGEEKVAIGGSVVKYGTTYLILFRNAIDISADVPDEIETAGVFDGKYLHMTWRCSICDAPKKWKPGKEIIQHLSIMYLAE